MNFRIHFDELILPKVSKKRTDSEILLRHLINICRALKLKISINKNPKKRSKYRNKYIKIICAKYKYNFGTELGLNYKSKIMNSV